MKVTEIFTLGGNNDHDYDRDRRWRHDNWDWGYRRYYRRRYWDRRNNCWHWDW